jgi:hypothetical protein
MASDTHHSLSGLVLEWPDLKVERSSIDRFKRLSFKRDLPADGWEEYELVSQEPLRGEDRPGATTFRYPVTCHRCGPQLLVLSIGRSVVDHLMTAELREFFPPLCRVSVAVDRFAKEITAHPSTYTLSFIHARVPAFGATLRSVSFYGDDLAEASLFRDHLHLMTCFTCGVKYAAGGPEIARIGNDGGISFMAGGWGKLGDVDAFMTYLRNQGYVVPRPGIRL